MTAENPFDLTGRVAVVTGAGKGIGRGIALCLARVGADLALAARSAADVEAVAAEARALGVRAIAVPTDVTDLAQLEALGERTVSELGQLDIWVSNAGGLPDATPRYLTRTPEDRWDAQLDLNLKAVWAAAVVAAKHMERGCIVNISSRSARGPSLKNGPYGAAKAAVNSLTESLALELAPAIRVNAVAPGPVPTENFNESTRFPAGKPVEEILRVPLGRLGEPEDVGNAVVFMASDAASWVTGQCLYVAGGL
ncbi:MAG: SDR family oxidoreductase [Pseudomonadota bacterium]